MCRNPGDLFWTIPLLIEQVLKTSPTMTRTKEAADVIGNTPFDEPGQRGGGGAVGSRELSQTGLTLKSNALLWTGVTSHTFAGLMTSWIANGPMNLGANFLHFSRKGTSPEGVVVTTPSGQLGRWELWLWLESRSCDSGE